MTDLDALTLTLWGEARGEPIEGKIAVAMVIRNRLLKHWRGANTYADVCLAHAQFSAWTQEVSQLSAEEQELASGKMDPALKLCQEIAAATIAGFLADNTKGADSYLTKDLYDKAAPNWAQNRPILQLGN